MKRYIYILLVLITVSTSCKKDFIETNTNPNTSEFAKPEALLAPALTKVVSYNMSRAQRITNEFMQVTVNMGDGDGKFFRYEVRISEADYLYTNWFLQIKNFKNIVEEASTPENFNKTYQAIGLISQSWVFSLLTDTYGDIPYFEAGLGRDGVVTPKFDRQKDVYLDVFKQLEAANTLLKEVGTAASGNVVESSDPVFGGNAVKWRKFGNSLYLRLLLRLSDKAEVSDLVRAKIKEIVDEKPADYPLISSNAESAVLRWTGAGAYVSPFATWRPADWYGPRIASFFVDNLNEWGDPRREKWVTLSQGEYMGVPSGYAVGEAPEPRSSFPTSLQAEPLLGNILNYSEVQFMIAELAVRGIVNKSAREAYESGITNGITFWGYTLPTGYLTNSSIAWDEDYSLQAKMEQIHVQKYYSLFFTDIQSWAEYRRTGLPNLPKGAGLRNGGVMPARLNYPIFLQAANGNNYRDAVAIQGPDNITTQVWWQKP